MGGLWILIFITLFVSGFLAIAFLKDRNLLIILMAFELMFFAVGVAFMYYSLVFFDFKGLIYALVLLAVAAGEAAVGLSVIMMLFRRSGDININAFSKVKY